jgi:hypothetical protein
MIQSHRFLTALLFAVTTACSLTPRQSAWTASKLPACPGQRGVLVIQSGSLAAARSVRTFAVHATWEGDPFPAIQAHLESRLAAALGWQLVSSGQTPDAIVTYSAVETTEEGVACIHCSTSDLLPEWAAARVDIPSAGSSFCWHDYTYRDHRLRLPSLFVSALKAARRGAT